MKSPTREMKAGPSKQAASAIASALRGYAAPDQFDVTYALAYCALLGKKMGLMHACSDPIDIVGICIEDNDVAGYLNRTLGRIDAGARVKAFGEIVSHVTEEGLKDLLRNLDMENVWDRTWHLERSTPRDVIMLALRLLSPRPGSRVADFGSGIGSFLLQARDATENASVFGVEINPDTACLSRVRLSVPLLDRLFELYEGVPDGARRAVTESLGADIRVGDMLAYHERGICDYAFSSYPIAMRTAMLSDSSEFARRARAGELGYRRPMTADWVYNHFLVDVVAEDGKAVALMAGGACYNTTDAGARRYFVEHGLIESVITLPRRLFPGTGLSLNVIVLSRGNKGVRMVDASDLYVEGRRTNKLSDGAIDEISRRLENDVDGYSGTVGIDELAAANFALSPSRYLGRPLVVKDARRLGDVAREIRRGATLRAGDLDEMSVNEATDCRYLMLRDIQDGTIADELPYLSGIDSKLEKHCIEDGDVLLSKNGAPFKVAVAEVPEGTRLLANGNLYIIRVDRDLIDPYYLAAFLGSNKGMEVLSSAVVGVTIPNIPLRTLREVPVSVPPLDEQREIVATYQAKLDEVRVLKLRAQRAIDEVLSLFDGEE